MTHRNQVENSSKEQKRMVYDDFKEPVIFKQSAFFNNDKKLDPQELRFQQLEEKIVQIEEMNSRKFDHLEERVRQVNQKFERIEQLGERLESMNKLIDTLKSNFDAKLMVFEDKYQQQNSKLDKKLANAIEKLKTDPNDQSRRSLDDGDLAHLVRKSIQMQKELQYDVCLLKQSFGSKDVRQSDVLLSKKHLDIATCGILKQSNVINGSTQGTLQSPSSHQRIDSVKISQQQRIRSITLEKQNELEQQKQRSRNESSNVQLITEEDEEKKQKSRPKKQEENPNIVDKYQFTLQSKNNQQQQENQIGPQAIKNSGQQSQLKQSFVNTNSNGNGNGHGSLVPNYNMNSAGNINLGIHEHRDRTQSKGTIQMKKGLESGKISQPSESGRTQWESTTSSDSLQE